MVFGDPVIIHCRGNAAALGLYMLLKQCVPAAVVKRHDLTT